jgi:hypothetical protein
VWLGLTNLPGSFFPQRKKLQESFQFQSQDANQHLAHSPAAGFLLHCPQLVDFF